MKMNTNTNNSKDNENKTHLGKGDCENRDSTTDSDLDEWLETGGRITPREQKGSRSLASLQAEIDDPFRPRASLSRSPTKEERKEQAVVCLLSPEEATQATQMTEQNPYDRDGKGHTPGLEENVLVQRGQILKMTKQAAKAKVAIKAIYDYALATKNVSRLLKEMGGKALHHLGVLIKDLGDISVMEQAEQKQHKNSESNPTRVDKKKERECGTQTSPVVTTVNGCQSGGAASPVKQQIPVEKGIEDPSRRGKRKETSPLEPRAGKFQRRKNPQEEAKRPPNMEEARGRGEESQSTGVEDIPQDSADERGFQEWRKRKRKAGSQRRGETENPPTKERIRRQTVRRGEAVSLRLGPGLTFAEAVKRMKSNLGTAPDGVKKIRRTLIGDLLVEFDPGADVSCFYNKINGKMGLGIELKRLQPKFDVEIRDIDPSVEGQEVLTALAAQLKASSEDLRLKSLKTNKQGMKVAIIEMTESMTENVRQMTSVKIGWTRNKLRVLPRITRCFACHGFGHLAKNCPRGPDARDTCRKCGEEGHKMDICKAESKCSLCLKAGKVGNALGHVAGSVRCPIYKEVLQKAGYKNQT